MMMPKQPPEPVAVGLSVPLSRFTPRFVGGAVFYVRGNMSTMPTQPLLRTVACAPLVLGLAAFALWAIYMLQRSGFLFPNSFERFVQHHLDGVAAASFTLAAMGIALGLYLGRGGRRTKLLLWGTLISVGAVLAKLFYPCSTHLFARAVLQMGAGQNSSGNGKRL